MIFKICLSLLVIQLLATPSNGNPSLISSTIESTIQELIQSQDMLKTRLIQLELRNQDQEKRLNDQEKKLSDQGEQINHLKLKVAELEGKEPAKLNQNILPLSRMYPEEHANRAATPPPSNCNDIKALQTESTITPAIPGYYIVKDSSNKLATVFCDFLLNQVNPGYETLMGYNYFKSTSVNFYVQRNSVFTTANAVVTFDIERLNEGGAMDIKTGIFTAPINGIYHFSLSGVKDATNTALAITLRLNNIDIGMAYGANLAGSLTYSLESTLSLVAGDEITLVKGATGTIQDSISHYTHFNGRLLEEL